MTKRTLLLSKSLLAVGWLAMAAPSGASTLVVSPDDATVEVGQLIVLRVTGDPQGASDVGLFGKLRFSSHSLSSPRGASQEPVGPLFSSGPLNVFGPPNAGAAEAFNQYGGLSEVPAPPSTFAQVGMCAQQPGTLSAEWIPSDPYTPFALNYFDVVSASGTSVSIVPTGTPPPYDGFNIDLGDGEGTPGTGFGALAEQPGDWNTLGLGGSAPLLNRDGTATGVTVSVSAESTESDPGPASDEQALFGDHISDCSTPRAWSLSFSGLSDGTHEVVLHAPGDSGTGTGSMLVNGTSVSAFGGSKKVWTQVTGGSLVISGGEPNSSSSCSGLAGVQLVVNCLPEPSGALSWLAGAGLVGLLGRRRRS